MRYDSLIHVIEHLSRQMIDKKKEYTKKLAHIEARIHKVYCNHIQTPHDCGRLFAVYQRILIRHRVPAIKIIQIMCNLLVLFVATQIIQNNYNERNADFSIVRMTSPPGIEMIQMIQVNERFFYLQSHYKSIELNKIHN